MGKAKALDDGIYAYILLRDLHDVRNILTRPPLINTGKSCAVLTPKAQQPKTQEVSFMQSISICISHSTGVVGKGSI